MKRFYTINLALLCFMTCCMQAMAQQVSVEHSIQASRTAPSGSQWLMAGTYQIRYGISKSTNNGNVTKPIVVVEGWDPFNNTGHADIYTTLETGLRNQLFQDDYDIITLNFNDTSAPIEANAMVLVALIEHINNNLKQGNEALVVVGMSMGGLVSRYGLRAMEDLNIDHKTSLYVSFDVPHQGATLPEGLYSMASHVANLQFSILGNPLAYLRSFSPELNDLYNMLLSPSVNQMLKNSPTQSGWQTFFQNHGYPENMRKVAISNGSMVGRNQRNTAGTFLQPGDLLFGFGGNNFLGLEDIVSANMQIRAAQSGIKIADLDIDFENFFSTQLVDFEDYGISTDKPYEISPGGFFQLENVLGPINDVLPGVQVNTTGFTFVPFASALDIDPFFAPYLNIDLTQFDGGIGFGQNWDILCFSPFDNIIAAPGDNEAHLSMTTRTANWLYQEIVGNPQATLCRNFCPSLLSLTEIDEMCPNETRTVQVVGLPAGQSVSWSVGSGLSIVGPSTGNTIQVKADLLSLAPSAHITATISTPCDYFFQPTIVSRTVNLGGPDALGDISMGLMLDFPSEVCTNTVFNAFDFYAGGSADADYYEWQSSLSLTNNISYGLAQTTGTTQIYTTSPVQHYIRVRAVNSCGASAWTTRYFTLNYNPNGCSGGGIGGLGLGAGFSRGGDFSDPQLSNEKPGTIKLYDHTGKLVYSGQKDFNELGTIDRDIVPDGRYFIHIFKANGVIRKQIRLERERR